MLELQMVCPASSKKKKSSITLQPACLCLTSHGRVRVSCLGWLEGSLLWSLFPLVRKRETEWHRQTESCWHFTSSGHTTWGALGYVSAGSLCSGTWKNSAQRTRAWFTQIGCVMQRTFGRNAVLHRKWRVESKISCEKLQGIPQA